jgi:hypothetical protein
LPDPYIIGSIKTDVPPLALVPVGFKGEQPFISSTCAVSQAAAIQF